MKKGKIYIPSSFLLDMTCVMWLCSMPMRILVSKILGVFGIGAFTIPVVGILIFLPLIIYILFERRLPWRYFHWILLFCILFFGVTLLVHPEYKEWYTRDIYGVMYTVFRPDHGAVWAFLMIEISGTRERIWKNLKIYSLVLFAYCFYQLHIAQIQGYWTSFNAIGELAEKSYSLDFGYDMIFICLIALSCYFMEKKTICILFCVLSAFLAVVYGSRGALICMCIYFLFYFLNGSQKEWRRFFYSIAIILAGIIVYFWGMTILQTFASFLLEIFHVSSRTLTQIINGNLMDDSGRDAIYQIAREAISENPIWGYGAYGDRPFIGPVYYWGYSHSIFYEMMIDFGVILGSVLLGIIIYKSAKLIFGNSDKMTGCIFLVIFSMDMRLLVSDTFWGNRFFWMTLALLFVCNRNFCREVNGDDRPHFRVRINVHKRYL